MRECRILDTWSVSGMRGTGSNDCVFTDVFVPDGFTYAWPNPPRAGGPGRSPIFRSPSSSGAGRRGRLGAAQHAIDTLMEIASARSRRQPWPVARAPPGAMQVAQAEGWLRAGRAYLFGVERRGVAPGRNRRGFDREARAAARLASVTAVKLAAVPSISSTRPPA